jgi:hypothetical protein
MSDLWGKSFYGMIVHRRQVLQGHAVKRLGKRHFESNLIKSVSTGPIASAGANVIDGGGRTLNHEGREDIQEHHYE